MNNMFISSAKKDEAVENFVKSKREELEKMIPGFVDDRKFTDIVLNFYERNKGRRTNDAGADDGECY
jgi:hypothetical protein